MFNLFIIGVIITSFIISGSQPKIAAIFDMIVGFAVLFLKIIPGTATLFDWVVMVLLFIAAGLLFFTAKINEKTRKQKAIRVYK